MPPSILVWSAALLLLYASRPVLINFSKHCQYNPQPAKLLLFAEAAKLIVTAVTLYGISFLTRVPVAKSHLSRSQPGTATAVPAAAAAAAALDITFLLKLSIPACCYFCSNNLLFFALERLPVHAYALLCNLTVITTAAVSRLLLQQRFSRQARWSLLLLLATVNVGHLGSPASSYAASSSSSSSAVMSGAMLVGVKQPQPQQQQQQQQQQQEVPAWIPSWALELLLMLAIAAFSAVGSVTSELILSMPQQQQQQQQQLQAGQAASCAVHMRHAAGLYCWGVLLNGLWLWQYSSKSSSTLLPSADSLTAAAGGGGVVAAQSQLVQWGCHVPELSQTAIAAAAAAAAATGDSARLQLFSDMGSVHWAVVVVLAVLGLVAGQVIRQQGSIRKAYIASLAMLPVAAISHLVEQQQQQHPMLLYFAACCFAAAAVMHLQQQQQQQQKAPHTPDAKKAFRSSQTVLQQLPSSTYWVLSSMTWMLGASPLSSSSSISSSGSSGGSSTLKTGALHLHHDVSAAASAGGKLRLGGVENWAAVGGVSDDALGWLAGFFDRLAAAVVLLSVLLLITGALPPSSSSSSSNGGGYGGVYWQQRDPSLVTSAAAAAGQAAMYNTTDVPMPQELISTPCIDGTWLQRDRFCPVVNCSLAPDCTVSDPSCCAHLNFQMLAYLDHLLTAGGLSQHYVIVYGTLLGAVRNKTILAHTNDVDVAMSAAAIAFLTQRSMQLELWRHGYVFWCSDNVWRLCGHRHHPVTAFQRLMRPRQQHTLQGGPYADVYLMWPSDAAKAAAVDAATAALHSHPAPAAAAGLPAAADAAPLQQQAAMNGRSHSTPRHSRASITRSKWRIWGGRRQEWQLCFSSVLVRLSGHRRASVEGLKLVVPDNSEQLLQGTYGPRWRTPNLRPYAPSYDEDNCVEKVRALNATIYRQ